MKRWNNLTHQDVDELLEKMDTEDMGTFEIIEFIEDRLCKLNMELWND